jgi:hypothetical protein
MPPGVPSSCPNKLDGARIEQHPAWIGVQSDEHLPESGCVGARFSKALRLPLKLLSLR